VPDSFLLKAIDVLEGLKKEYAGRFDVEFIDVWKNPDVGKQYGIGCGGCPRYQKERRRCQNHHGQKASAWSREMETHAVSEETGQGGSHRCEEAAS
jgi:uncharacterized ParB-like nuclease family protein